MTIRQTHLSAPGDNDSQIAPGWWKQSCETGGGSLQPGGRLVYLRQLLATVLAWLDGRGPPAEPTICTRYMRWVLITGT